MLGPKPTLPNFQRTFFGLPRLISRLRATLPSQIGSFGDMHNIIFPLWVGVIFTVFLLLEARIQVKRVSLEHIYECVVQPIAVSRVVVVTTSRIMRSVLCNPPYQTHH